MRALFWFSALCVSYTFFGYPALIWTLARVRRRPVHKASVRPTVSVVMAVHNGADNLAAKLKNVSEMSYPRDLLEIVVASDGSTDETNQILRAAPEVRTVYCPRVGKAEALNRAVAVSSNEILVFTDVRQRIEPNALAELVGSFADEHVGCVSGELMFTRPAANSVSGLSTYWTLEKFVRKAESDSGSVIGATGALYAIRRSLFTSLPVGTLLDDVFVPLHVVKDGKRVVFEPKAQVWDAVSETSRSEFLRKVRTLAGNFQIVEFAPWVMTNKNVRFRFLSHKLLRLVAPWLLGLVFVSSLALASSAFYLAMASLQFLLYTLAIAMVLLPGLARGRFMGAIKIFFVMNAAAMAAPLSYLRHRRDPNKIWAITSSQAKTEPLPATVAKTSANSSS